jgi:hypothetical protein
MHRYLENPAFGRALEKEVPCDEMNFPIRKGHRKKYAVHVDVAVVVATRIVVGSSDAGCSHSDAKSGYRTE